MALDRTATLTFSADQVIATNTTGAYAVSTNPGGYGAPNPTFAAFAHYAIIRKKNVNEVADEVLILDSYNPISATVFTADRDPDGWYEATLFDIDVWNSGTSYVGGTLTTGNVVYDAGILYCCTVSNSNSKPSLNPSKWTVVTDLTTIEGNTTLYTTVEGRVTAYDADVYWSKQIADLSQKGQCSLQLIVDDKLKARLDLILLNIQCAKTADQLGSNSSGEWAILRLRHLGAKKAA